MTAARHAPASTPLLLMSLEAAVPLWIASVRGWAPAVRARLATESAEIICAKGDVLQFGGGKKGEAAHAFNCLARALAILSFAPGGVKFAGLTWESR